MSDDETMKKLREMLEDMPPQQLQHYGITLAPYSDDWQWVRDCLVTALLKAGRKSGKILQEFPFAGVHTTYSVGLNREVLTEFGRAARKYLENENGLSD